MNLGPLKRFVCGDVRDLIVSQKTDHGPAHWRYRALQQWRCLKICFREIFGTVRFSTFATISAKSRALCGPQSIGQAGNALPNFPFFKRSVPENEPGSSFRGTCSPTFV